MDGELEPTPEVRNPDIQYSVTFELAAKPEYWQIFMNSDARASFHSMMLDMGFDGTWRSHREERGQRIPMVSVRARGYSDNLQTQLMFERAVAGLVDWLGSQGAIEPDILYCSVGIDCIGTRTGDGNYKESWTPEAQGLIAKLLALHKITPQDFE